jgi:hypothetical protein
MRTTLESIAIALVVAAAILSTTVQPAQAAELPSFSVKKAGGAHKAKATKGAKTHHTAARKHAAP